MRKGRFGVDTSMRKSFLKTLHLNTKTFEEAFDFINQNGDAEMGATLLNASQKDTAISIFNRAIKKQESLFKFEIDVHNRLVDILDEEGVLSANEYEDLNKELEITGASITRIEKSLKSLRRNLLAIADFNTCIDIHEAIPIIQFRVSALDCKLSGLFNTHLDLLHSPETKSLDLAELAPEIEISDETYSQFIDKWKTCDTANIKIGRSI